MTRPGQSFEDAAVAANHQCRPEYPDATYDLLVALSPGRSHALDLGCGTGKIARGLSPRFAAVTAVDASAPMLAVASALHRGGADNVKWVQGLAESVDLGEAVFDLVVADASIHWMDHAVLFPRLLGHVRSDHVFAVVDGDGAYEPPWEDAWDAFLAKWLWELKGDAYQPHQPDSDYHRFMTRYRDWIDVQGERHVQHEVSQTIDEFVRCQHSRDSFAPAKLGSKANAFDAELRQLLEPHAHGERLIYHVRTRIEWGSIQRAPAGVRS